MSEASEYERRVVTRLRTARGHLDGVIRMVEGGAYCPHCNHCRTSIEGALKPLAGVAEASVDMAAKTVTVTYDEVAVGRDQLITAIEDQGYEVPA